jgi:hypothetical protein
MTQAERDWRDGPAAEAGPAEDTCPPADDVREDPAADIPPVADVPEDPVAADIPPVADVPEEPLVAEAPEDPLVTDITGDGEHDRFVARWQEIQAGFVDEPRRAVQDADALVVDLMDRLARVLAEERDRLEPRPGTGEDVSTEDLRQGLRRYRSLFERLLAV